MDEHQVVEGISGVWHFHLAKAGASPTQGLCGARTMGTGMRVEDWGARPGHMRHSYCAECARQAGITGGR